LDYSSPDSTPPPLKNACTGTWSSSPLFSASKASTVSATHRWTKLMSYSAVSYE
jgi:hypothetical protein